MPLVPGLDVGGEPCLPTSARSCSPAHGVVARKTAFLLVGAARQLEHPLVHTSYASHVLRAFGAHSRTQLFLHLGHENPRRPGEAHPLDGAIAALQPARVEVVPLAHHAQTVPPRTCLPNEERWSDADYQRRALQWWGALSAAWTMVRNWEREEGHARFESVFVSRPDLVFTDGFGPACAYAGDVWYTAGIGSPDMLWLMPRRIAAAVLSTLHTFTTCSEDLSAAASSGAAATGTTCADDWAASYWPLSYWTRRLNISVSTAMLGSAKLLGSVKPRAGRTRVRRAQLRSPKGRWLLGEDAADERRGEPEVSRAELAPDTARAPIARATARPTRRASSRSLRRGVPEIL